MKTYYIIQHRHQKHGDDYEKGWMDMKKSYGNEVYTFETPEEAEDKIKKQLAYNKLIGQDWWDYRVIEIEYRVDSLWRGGKKG